MGLTEISGSRQRAASILGRKRLEELKLHLNQPEEKRKKTNLENMGKIRNLIKPCPEGSQKTRGEVRQNAEKERKGEGSQADKRTEEL